MDMVELCVDSWDAVLHLGIPQQSNIISSFILSEISFVLHAGLNLQFNQASGGRMVIIEMYI